MNIVLIIIVSIAIYIAYEAAQYSRLEKERNERAYKQSFIKSNRKKKDTKCCSKVSKNKSQNKNKPKSAKGKVKVSKKISNKKNL